MGRYEDFPYPSVSSTEQALQIAPLGKVPGYLNPFIFLETVLNFLEFGFKGSDVFKGMPLKGCCGFRNKGIDA
jgi:hypothetical protein